VLQALNTRAIDQADVPAAPLPAELVSTVDAPSSTRDDREPFERRNRHLDMVDGLRWGALGWMIVAAACGAGKPDDGASTVDSASSGGTSTSSGGTSTSGGGSSQIPPLVECGTVVCGANEVCAVTMSSCCPEMRCEDVSECLTKGEPLVTCACGPEYAEGYDPATGTAMCEAHCETTACAGAGDTTNGAC
jgi:hypothetical protein